MTDYKACGPMIKVDKIKNFEKAAEVFSEGSEDLRNLLLNCWKLNIKTCFCCNHNKYISFLVDDNSRKYLGGLLSLVNGNIYLQFDKYAYEKNLTVNRLAIFCFKSQDEESFFKRINEEIMEKIGLESAFKKIPPIAGNLFNYISNDKTCPKLESSELAGFRLSYMKGDYYMSITLGLSFYNISKENLSLKTLTDNLKKIVASQREIIKDQ